MGVKSPYFWFNIHMTIWKTLIKVLQLDHRENGGTRAVWDGGQQQPALNSPPVGAPIKGDMGPKKYQIYIYISLMNTFIFQVQL